MVVFGCCYPTRLGGVVMTGPSHRATLIFGVSYTASLYTSTHHHLCGDGLPPPFAVSGGSAWLL
jgi:hypothetical protein